MKAVGIRFPELSVKGAGSARGLPVLYCQFMHTLVARSVSNTLMSTTADDPLYDERPFRRDDQYGTMGLAPQKPAEYLRLAIVCLTILPLKVLGCSVCIVSCFLACRLAALLPAQYRLSWIAAAGKVCARCCLFCIGFWSVQWHKVLPKAGQKAATASQLHSVAGIVSNHCSWTDILVHMAHSFPSFVAKAATKRILLIGFVRCGTLQMAAAAASVFAHAELASQ